MISWLRKSNDPHYQHLHKDHGGPHSIKYDQYDHDDTCNRPQAESKRSSLERKHMRGKRCQISLKKDKPGDKLGSSKTFRISRGMPEHLLLVHINLEKTSTWSTNSYFLCKIWGRHWNQDHDDHCQKKVRPQKIFARGNWGWRRWRWQALVSSACPT